MLPHITDDELITYHLDDLRAIAMQDYMRRCNIDPKTADFNMIHEQFQWEWDQRLYENGDPE